MTTPQPTPTRNTTSAAPNTDRSFIPDANPLLAAWTTPNETPPFGAIHAEQFRPGFDHAMAEQMAEIACIAANPEPENFANTILALERSGAALNRVSSVFHALAGAHTDDALMAIEREMSPRLAAHRNRIHLNAALFARIDALWNRRDALGLTPEQARVLERYHVTFRRAGAGLAEDAKARIAAIGERLAELGTAFSQNVLADEQAYALVLESEEDLAGLSEGARAAAAAAASERGLPGKHAITLARSSVEPFLASSARRDLREKALCGLDRPRPRRRGDRQHRDHRRDHRGCAPNERKAPRLSDLCALPPRRRHGEDAGPCADLAGAGLEVRRANAPWPTATPCRR